MLFLRWFVRCCYSCQDSLLLTLRPAQTTGIGAGHEHLVWSPVCALHAALYLTWLRVFPMTRYASLRRRWPPALVITAPASLQCAGDRDDGRHPDATREGNVKWEGRGA